LLDKDAYSTKWLYCNLLQQVKQVAVPTTKQCDHLIQAKTVQQPIKNCKIQTSADSF